MVLMTILQKRKAAINMSKEELKTLQKKIMRNVKIYREDNTDNYYAKFYFRGHYEVHPVNSPMFYAFLNSSLRKLTNKYDSADWHEIINVSKENTLLNDTPVNVYKRLAGDEKAVWYFLADRDWSCIYATKDGWSVINDHDKLFIKSKNMKQQVIPVSDGNHDRLRNYVNLNNNDYLLFKINLIHNFFFVSSHYIGIINANFGYGKSMLTRLWRRIVDPANAEFTSLSANIDDFKIQLANNTFVMLDNTRKLSPCQTLYCFIADRYAVFERYIFFREGKPLTEYVLFSNMDISIRYNRSEAIFRSQSSLILRIFST